MTPYPKQPGTAAPVTSSSAMPTPRVALLTVAMAFSACVAALTLIPSATAQIAAEPSRHFSSGSATVALVELFTSEGCSSCPPADRWLSALKTHDGLWTEFVPVAFHVNYWDYLGWPDRFAKEQFAQRQRRYAKESIVRGVYTPSIVSAGEEWHGWRQGRRVPKPGPGAGELSATLQGDDLRVNYAPTGSDSEGKEYRIHAAWLAMDQVSRVKKGENRGKRLLNDFVVVTTLNGQTTTEDGIASTRFSADKLSSIDAKALAIWVTQDGLQAPIQATGGWIK